MPRATRRCARPGCDNRAPCQTHKPAPWTGSDRSAALPRDWPAVVAAILRRDPTCQLAYPGQWMTRRGPASCAGTSTEVDHIGRRDNHAPANLRGVCTPCHKLRTARQAGAARRRK